MGVVLFGFFVCFLGFFSSFSLFYFFVPFIVDLAVWGRQGDSWNSETSPNSLCISISDLPPNHGQDDKREPWVFCFLLLFWGDGGLFFFFWTVLRTSLFLH